jgi:Copper binding proteins, plastocyanin/azurin family
MRLVAAVTTFSALLVILASTGGAQAQGTTQLTGTVGPGFTITLKTGTKAVKTLAAAKYTFVINDKSDIHNFHLTGPGVNKKTTVAFMGTTRWTLTLRAGTYTYLCDPHATAMMGGQMMRGQFVVRAT